MASARQYDPGNPPDYKPISAYGVIGDCRTAALIGDDGSIDWACFPDFDSAAVFAAILDPKGGRFILQPSAPFTSHQFYEQSTNILCTEFRTDSGEVRIRDFMPMITERRLPASEIHRKIEGVSGKVEMALIFEPRFDYGTTMPEFEAGPYGVMAKHRNDSDIRLVLSSPIPLELSETGAGQRFSVEGGDSLWFVADWDSHGTHPIAAYRSESRIGLARGFWRDWVSKLKYHGNWRSEVERCLLALKLLTYGPTGAVIAAATTSLPEWPGGVRNWDYRYTWVRDSAFMLRALFEAGYVDEGTAYFDWLLERCIGSPETGLNVMYSVRGDADIPEREISLRGWQDSGPVRVGNGAVNQFQLDIFGSLIDAALHYQQAGGVLTMVEAERLAAIIELVRRRWREPDDGIWEARDGPRHYTYSKVWAWVALDRGVRLARELNLDLPWESWTVDAETIRRDVLSNAYNPQLEAFTQFYGSEILDAAVLIMPITGIISANDPRFRTTQKQILDKLAAGPYPLLYRYDPKLATDGVGGEEGAFLLPSFWLVEVLILAGQYKEARATFEALLQHASRLGLFSEEIHPISGDLLGNFPQGFSHLGMINAAIRLESAGLGAGTLIDADVIETT